MRRVAVLLDLLLIVVLCDVFPLLKIQMFSLLAERSERVTDMPILLSGKFTV